MKKEKIIKSEKSAYSISVLIGNIALLDSIDYKSCLYNIKTHEQISKFDKYYVTYYSKEKFYFVKLPTSTNDEKYYDVYDAEQEKYLIQNLLYVDGDFSFSIFKDTVTNKFHLFDYSLVRTDKNVLLDEYDDIKFLPNSYFGHYAVVTKNGKKGVYKCGEGFVLPFIYDDIRVLDKNNEICILEKNGKKQFAFHMYSEGFIESKKFDDIWCDENYPQILYCKDESNIYIYDLKVYSNRLMCKIPLVDEIKCSYIYDKGRYMFIVKKNSKYGIYGFNGNYKEKFDKNSYDPDCMYYFNSSKEYPSEYKPASYLDLVPIIYDGIEYKNSDYILYSDLSGNNIGKKSYYGYNSYNNKDYYKAEKCDDILVFGNILLLFNGDDCDIYTFDRFDEAYIRKCRYIEHVNESIIYEKYGRRGIFMYDSKYPFIYSNLDSIEKKDNFNYSQVFVVNKHAKQGVLFGKRELIKPDNIKVEQIYNPNTYSDKKLYFVISTNGKKSLKYLHKKDYYSELELDSIPGEYSRVEFFKDFYLLDDNNEVTLFDYENNKITTFVKNTIVEQLEIDREKGKITVYKIEDKYYFYYNGVFEEALEENINRYIATFEVNDDIYEINTVIKEEFDSFCDTIDSKTEEEAIQLFEKYIKDNYTLRNRYSCLSLVKKNKE